MTRRWFSGELETVASFWRVARRDGVTLGFVSHDRDLRFDGVLHRAAPGMLPSAIRLSAGLDADSAEVKGALSHHAISALDLALGRYDGARVVAGVVDWESGEHEVLYTGTIGAVSEQDGAFSAELISRKVELDRDTVPRTSPVCRAQFCGPGCGLSAARFSHETNIIGSGSDGEVITAGALNLADCVSGNLRWIDGPYAGLSMGVVAATASALQLDEVLADELPSGLRVVVREGCDHRLETCSSRFGNAINFQGEPFLPGNDMVTRYPVPGQ